MTLQIPYFVALTTYVSYGLMFVFGHFRDTFRSIRRLIWPPPPEERVSAGEAATGPTAAVHRFQGAFFAGYVSRAQAAEVAERGL